MDLNDFVTEHSRILFTVLGLDTSFMNGNPAEAWPDQSHRLERVVPTHVPAGVRSRGVVAAMFCPSVCGAVVHSHSLHNNSGIFMTFYY